MLDRVVRKFNKRGQIAIRKSNRQLIDQFCHYLQTNRVPFGFVNRSDRMVFSKEATH